MELPSEIWGEIIKNSKKTLYDYISEIDDPSNIEKIVDKLWEKRRQLWYEKKSSFSVGDIVKDTKNNLYVVVYINYKSDCPTVKLSKVIKSQNWSNWGYYTDSADIHWKNVTWLELFEKRTDIDIQLDTYIQSLKVGDTIKYNHMKSETYGYEIVIKTGIIKTINVKSITLNCPFFDSVRIPKKNVLIS